MIMHGIETRIKEMHRPSYNTTYITILKCKFMFPFTPNGLDELFPNPARQRKIE
jgi:hypothetical protein